MSNFISLHRLRFSLYIYKVSILIYENTYKISVHILPWVGPVLHMHINISFVVKYLNYTNKKFDKLGCPSCSSRLLRSHVANAGGADGYTTIGLEEQREGINFYSIWKVLLLYLWNNSNRKRFTRPKLIMG